MQEGLDLLSAAAASDYKINQSTRTSLDNEPSYYEKTVEKNKQKKIAAVSNATPEGETKEVSVPSTFQSISYDAVDSSKNRMKGPTVTTAASTALFNAIIRDHDDGRTVILSEVRALLASGSRLTNAEIASIRKKITNLEETASEEMAGGDHGWAWENVAKAKTMQEGLDLLSAAAASDYKINQSTRTSLDNEPSYYEKTVEKNKQKLYDGSSESKPQSKPQSKEASKCGPAPAPGKSSPLESNTTAQANLEQKILAAKNAYREAEDIDPTSSDNDALKSIWIALLADLKKLQSNE
jgi:stage V sporulation protein SpoVS